MADGFIVRKGGVAVDITTAPSINFVSKTFDSITFTITNNDALTADIFWEIGDSTPDANTLSLAGGATSSNQVASGLDAEETYTIFAFANTEGKAGSQTTSQVRTTPAVPIVYTAATGGTTEEYDDGGKRYKSHTFTSDGTFTVTTVGDATGDRNAVDYLIIAGGGGSGIGGSGAGGYRTTITPVPSDQSADSKVVVTAQGYTVTVGGGGTAVTTSPFDGNTGTNSSALGITASGGGGGGGNSTSASTRNGGSGGGGRNFANADVRAAGSGILGQGRNGGTGTTGRSGGGGGAGAVGQDGQASVSGNGGNGLANTLRDGTSETRAGGGGGFGASSGGTGGGGNGTGNPKTTSGAATANTGGGAGGAETGDGDNGGSGIVIIRYEIAPSV